MIFLLFNILVQKSERNDTVGEVTSDQSRLSVVDVRVTLINVILRVSSTISSDLALNDPSPLFDSDRRVEFEVAFVLDRFVLVPDDR